MARTRTNDTEKSAKSPAVGRSVLGEKKPARRSRSAAPGNQSRSASKRITPKSRTVENTPRPAELIDAKTRWQMIQEAAYYLSEKQGFQPGHELQNWLRAEAQIDQQLK